MEATFDVINEAKSIFNKEMEALVKTRDSLGEDFENLVELALTIQDKLYQILEEKMLRIW